MSAGKVNSFSWQSQILAGTTRTVQVYIPANHDASKSTAVMVLQDGAAYIDNFGMPTVLDNLIADRSVPPQIAVFIAASANRSAEYDCLNDNYFRFVTEEILPEVERRYSVRISTDPWQRGIGGHSSGGSAAFTAGFRHPESFRRILTHNGSFTDLCRAGSPSAHTYPELIASAELKPLRVFLLTGTRDNGYDTTGDRNWVSANEEMFTALTAKGYHVRYVFATNGTHSQNAAASILPATLRWLWRSAL